MFEPVRVLPETSRPQVQIFAGREKNDVIVDLDVNLRERGIDPRKIPTHIVFSEVPSNNPQDIYFEIEIAGRDQIVLEISDDVGNKYKVIEIIGIDSSFAGYSVVTPEVYIKYSRSSKHPNAYNLDPKIYIDYQVPIVINHQTEDVVDSGRSRLEGTFYLKNNHDRVILQIKVTDIVDISPIVGSQDPLAHKIEVIGYIYSLRGILYNNDTPCLMKAIICSHMSDLLMLEYNKSIRRSFGAYPLFGTFEEALVAIFNCRGYANEFFQRHLDGIQKTE